MYSCLKCATSIYENFYLKLKFRRYFFSILVAIIQMNSREKNSIFFVDFCKMNFFQHTFSNMEKKLMDFW